MRDTLGALMERNLFDVFGQRDSARRAAAIAELYTADCTRDIPKSWQDRFIHLSVK